MFPFRIPRLQGRDYKITPKGEEFLNMMKKGACLLPKNEKEEREFLYLNKRNEELAQNLAILTFEGKYFTYPNRAVLPLDFERLLEVGYIKERELTEIDWKKWKEEVEEEEEEKEKESRWRMGFPPLEDD
jgi:hypothetical protein